MNDNEEFMVVFNAENKEGQTVPFFAIEHNGRLKIKVSQTVCTLSLKQAQKLSKVLRGEIARMKGGNHDE